MKTTFFFSVPAVACKRVCTRGFAGVASAVSFLVLAWSTSDMTMLTTASLEKDLLSPPASTGKERKISPSESVQVPRANSQGVAGERKPLLRPARPKKYREISHGPR